MKASYDHNKTVMSLLSDINIASKKWIYEQYDHMVRTNTVILPGSDAAVIRVKGFKKGLAISSDGNGRLCYIDPYKGAKHIVCEAILNIACMGAKALGITNCLNFGNPENTEIMWQFVNVIDGMKEACEILDVPIVSGNVSFYNETQGINIYPTPVIVAVGSVENVFYVKSSFFKKTDSSIILLGSNTGELGGSIFADKYLKDNDLDISDIDLMYVNRLVQLLAELVECNLVEAAHDISDGGLAIALAEMCLGNNIGATIALNEELDDLFIYSEEKPRILIEARNENIDTIVHMSKKNDIEAQVLGSTNNNGFLKIYNRKRCYLILDVAFFA